MVDLFFSRIIWYFCVLNNIGALDFSVLPLKNKGLPLGLNFVVYLCILTTFAQIKGGHMTKFRYATSAKRRLSLSVTGFSGVWSRIHFKVVIAALILNVFLVSSYFAGPNGDGSMGLAKEAKAMSKHIDIPQLIEVDSLHAAEMNKMESVAKKIAKRYFIAGEAARTIVFEVWKNSQSKGLDPYTVLAIIAIESRFNPLAESSVGALGLGQVLGRAHPEKIAKVKKADGHILSMKDNIEQLTTVFLECQKLHRWNETQALLQYNGSLKDKSKSYAKSVLAVREKLLEKS